MGGSAGNKLHEAVPLLLKFEAPTKIQFSCNVTSSLLVRSHTAMSNTREDTAELDSAIVLACGRLGYPDIRPSQLAAI